MESRESSLGWHQTWCKKWEIKWVHLGDENTKILNIKASMNHMHNFIAMLQNDNQAGIASHDGKVAIL